jgi:TatD DNase family protein
MSAGCVITDSHAHVYDESFDADRDAAIERAREAGVARMLLVGTNVATSRRAFELAARHAGVFPTAGLHPHDAADAGPEQRAEIEALCRRPDCVAVGETGLDWFKQFSPREAQLSNFRWHLALARELRKPVIVHCRDAREDTLALLAEFPGLRGVMHCYSYGAAELGEFLALGMYISFSGVVTYPKNEFNREAARLVPSDRLLVETDCPYLAPQSKRGRRNEPALCREVLAKLAEVRGTTLDELARITSDNANALFDLPR